MRQEAKRLKPGKIREQKYADGFDPEIIEEYEDILEPDEKSFYDIYHRMERDRSLGRDESFQSYE